MNKIKTSYIAENIDLLANLTWKELETIYYLRIPSLKDYGKNLPDLPLSKSEDKSVQTSEKRPVKADIKLNDQANKKSAPNESEKDAGQKKSPSTTSNTIKAMPPRASIAAVDIGKPESGIVKAIQKQMQEHVSTSPFAKLKSNAPSTRQEPSAEPAPAQPLIKEVFQQKKSSQESDSDMDVAWFVEPAQDKKQIIDQVSAEIRAAQTQPQENPEKNLDTAIENAFGRMLKLTKNKILPPEPVSAPPIVPTAAPESKAVPEPTPELEPKLLPYSTPAAALPPEPEISPQDPSANSLLKPTFDFSPAEDLSATALPSLPANNPIPINDKEQNTQENQPIFPLEISAKIEPAIESINEPTYKSIHEPIHEPAGNPFKSIDAKSADAVDAPELNDTYVSRDVLRDLIQNHIKHASGQGADPGQAQSIGSGKEYEVWLNNPARSKFIGGSKAAEPSTPVKSPGGFKPRVVPADIRKSCLILGLRPENISYETVQDSWKKSIALPGVHPDQGGDTEMAVYLNTAKDILIRWLDAQAPKLGKKFGAPKKEP